MDNMNELVSKVYSSQKYAKNSRSLPIIAINYIYNNVIFINKYKRHKHSKNTQILTLLWVCKKMIMLTEKLCKR